MRDISQAYAKSGKLKDSENTYNFTWEDYSIKNEKSWKQYCQHQAHP